MDPSYKQQLKETVILVADDDAMVRQILMEHLGTFGFQNVLEAKNGGMALRYITDPNQRIDLIISDWEMPMADGLVLLRAVRNSPFRQSLKFIMVTSQNSRERVKISQAARLSVDAYMIKPFRGEVLKEKVFQVLGWARKKEAG